jgi:hypothetical protein
MNEATRYGEDANSSVGAGVVTSPCLRRSASTVTLATVGFVIGIPAGIRS